MTTVPPQGPKSNPPPKTTFIYVLIDPETNEVRYVGKANNLKLRLAGHLREKEDYRKNRWIHALISRNLTPIIQAIEEVSYDLWPERECYWIDFYRAQGCNLTNTSTGGIGGNGIVLSPEARAKISAAHMGKGKGIKRGPISEEQKRKQSEAMKGRKLTPEHKAKMSKALRDREVSTETRAKLASASLGKKRPELSAAMKGHEVPAETRAKIGARLRGKKLSPEAIEKRSATIRGSKRSEETKAKISAAHKGKKREPFSEEWKQKLGDSTRGKKRPPEVGQKVAAKLKGRKPSPEALAKMSLAQQRRRAMKKLPPVNTPTLWD